MDKIKSMTIEEAVALLQNWADMNKEYYPRVNRVYELLKDARQSKNPSLWDIALDKADDILSDTWRSVGTPLQYTAVCEAAALLGGYKNHYELPIDISNILSSFADWQNQFKDLIEMHPVLGENIDGEQRIFNWLDINLTNMKTLSYYIDGFIEASLKRMGVNG